MKIKEQTIDDFDHYSFIEDEIVDLTYTKDEAEKNRKLQKLITVVNNNKGKFTLIDLNKILSA